MGSVKVHAKEFTASEIVIHRSREDIYTVIHGKVYDITKFVDEHP